MSKDPAVLLYSSDFLAGIQDLTMEERGQYITLLCLQHQKGHLSDKAIKLSVGNAAADVMAKFRQDPAGLWYNSRMDKEIEKRQVHSKKQSERAVEGWRKRKKDAAVDATPEATAYATAMPLEDVNENEDIKKEVCKIFGKTYLKPSERLPSSANWFRDIDKQAEILSTSYPTPEEAVNQIRGYVRYCKANDRKMIGTAYKAAETILSSNWLALMGEHQARAPDKFEKAVYNKSQWTLEGWEEHYEHQLKTNPEFRKYFGYAELPPRTAMGIEN